MTCSSRVRMGWRSREEGGRRERGAGGGRTEEEREELGEGSNKLAISCSVSSS